MFSDIDLADAPIVMDRALLKVPGDLAACFVKRCALGTKPEVEVPAVVAGCRLKCPLELVQIEFDTLGIERYREPVGDDKVILGSEALQGAVLSAEMSDLGGVPGVRDMPAAAAVVVQREGLDTGLVEPRRVSEEVQLPQVS